VIGPRLTSVRPGIPSLRNSPKDWSCARAQGCRLSAAVQPTRMQKLQPCAFAELLASDWRRTSEQADDGGGVKWAVGTKRDKMTTIVSPSDASIFLVAWQPIGAATWAAHLPSRYPLLRCCGFVLPSSASERPSDGSYCAAGDDSMVATGPIKPDTQCLNVPSQRTVSTYASREGGPQGEATGGTQNRHPQQRQS
jgi:hypothetical protein